MTEIIQFGLITIAIVINVALLCVGFTLNESSRYTLREAKKINEFAIRRLEAMNDILTRMQKKNMSNVPDNKTLDEIVYGPGKTGIMLKPSSTVVRIQNWECAVLIIEGDPYPCFRINGKGPWFGFPVGFLQSTNQEIAPEDCLDLFRGDLEKCAQSLEGFRD